MDSNIIHTIDVKLTGRSLQENDLQLFCTCDNDIFSSSWLNFVSQQVLRSISADANIVCAVFRILGIRILVLVLYLCILVSYSQRAL